VAVDAGSEANCEGDGGLFIVDDGV